MTDNGHVETAANAIVQLPDWLRRSHGLASRELVGTIQRVTAKGILFSGHANIRETSNCLRCGRTIENPVSMLVGYGPYCSEELGIPRDFDPDTIDQLRATLVTTTAFEGWLPRQQCTVIADGEEIPWIDAAPEVPTSKLRLVDNQLRLFTHYDLRDKAKAVGGARWNKGDKSWRYDASPHTAANLIAEYARDESPLVLEGGVETLAAEMDVVASVQHIKSAEDLPDVPRTKMSAWNHQRQAYWFAHPLKSAALLMDMGTGKTKVTVDLVANRGHKRILVVCPNTVQRVWPREFRKHAPDGFDADVYTFNDEGGSIDKRRQSAEKVARLAAARDNTFVCVINYEAVWRPAFLDWALKFDWDLVVCDESHRIKGPGVKASKAMARIGRDSDYRLCLTGTALANSPLDAYGQYRFLDPGIFGSSFARFRARYAVVDSSRGFPQIKGWQNQQEFAEKLYSIAYEVGAEVLDLPEEQDIERVGQLSPKAKKLYQQITEDSYAEHEGKEFSTPIVLTRILRQQQITGGSLPSDDSEIVVIDDTKKKMLAELLSDLAEQKTGHDPVVVFCKFVHDLNVVKQVAADLNLRYGELSGREKTAITADAEMQPNIDVAAVQISAGGVGIDLTLARYAVYYSLGHSLTDYLQSRKRVHRPGQTRDTTYFHLVLENTVDEDVYRALSTKQDVVNFIKQLNPNQ